PPPRPAPRRQPLDAGDAASRPRRADGGRARGERDRPAPPAGGDPGEPRDARPPALAPDAGEPQGPRSVGGARRLRSRLPVPEPAGRAARGRRQARPRVPEERHREPRRRLAPHRGGGGGEEPEAARARPGDRERGPARAPAPAALRGGPGLPDERARPPRRLR